MAIKTILLRRPIIKTTKLEDLRNKKLNYGEPFYSPADNALVIGDGEKDADILDRIDIIPKDLSRKEIFLQSGDKSVDKDNQPIITNAILQDIDGNKIEVGGGTVKGIKVGNSDENKLGPDEDGFINIGTSNEKGESPLFNPKNIRIDNNGLISLFTTFGDSNHFNTHITMAERAPEASDGEIGDIWFDVRALDI